MLRIYDIPVAPVSPRERKAILENRLKKWFDGRLPAYRLARRSVDARKKDNLHYVYTVDIAEAQEARLQKLLSRRCRLKTEIVPEEAYAAPVLDPAQSVATRRPLIVGAGPAGLFCALILAEAGLKPLLIEQGASVEERKKDVEAFWNGAKLKPWSNVQFGEGGAGTFSDGKLNTGIKDPGGRIRKVLQTFADCGADPSILYDAKPHIGTDVLETVVRNLRNYIRELGGEVRFHTQLEDIQAENGKLKTAVLKNLQTEETTLLQPEALVLALGHSARQSVYRLWERGLALQPKAFAVGLRIQHSQSWLNRLQYGGQADLRYLPAADYKLTAKTADGRGVYSFCMCPGGQVVNASSEGGRLCVNGMSASARDGRNANAALIVQVGPADFGDELFAGLEFQRRLEEAAYACGGGQIPAQRLEDFSAGRATETEGCIQPDFCGLWRFARLDEATPDFIRNALLEAMPQFERKMRGFAAPDAILAGFEARSSSPLRMVRDESFQSNIRGLYPCGEGAGYAGGITSAAVDGIKTAEALLKAFGARTEKTEESVKGNDTE